MATATTATPVRANVNLELSPEEADALLTIVECVLWAGEIGEAAECIAGALDTVNAKQFDVKTLKISSGLLVLTKTKS